MMSIVVRKSSPVMVRPSPSPEPGTTTRGTIKLSSFDLSLYKVPSTLLLVFEHPIPDAAATIQGALSRALAHYYPIAGRIIIAGAGAGTAGADDDDDVRIDCTDEGVAFVAASSDHALNEAICFDRSPGASRKLLDGLAVYYDDDPAMGGCGAPGEPLLLVQVTEFSCGGFVLGVTWNHGVADGVGMGQFLRAVGDLAAAAGGKTTPSSPSSSLLPPPPPVRWDGSLPSLPPSVLEAQQHMRGLDPLTGIVTLDITIPMQSINRVRAELMSSSSSSLHGQPCTTFEVVLAVLWRCRERAIRLHPETPTLLIFVANVRKHVGAKEGYYGNCIAEQVVTAKSGAVAEGDLEDVVMVIQRAKDRIPERLNGEDEGGVMGKEELRMMYTYERLMLITSWRNLGFDEVDFGSGTPARVTTSAKDGPPSPAALGFVCSGRDGVNVLSALVKQEHPDAFQAELAKFM